MKLAKIALVLCLGLILIAGVFAGGNTQTPAATGGKIAVTFAGTEGATAGQSRMMTEVGEILNATGRFDVKVYVAGALPGDTDNLVTQARLGVNLVVPSDPGRLASQFNIPDLNILMAPYVLTDYTVLEKLPETALYKQWQAQLEAQGIVLIANMFNGFRSSYTTTPVNSVRELSGLRIRGFGNAIGTALAKYLGFAQTTMNATDIYSGIQARSLDGCEIQPSTADSYRLYEVTPYLALTRHYMLQSSFVCGKALLDGMPEADRATFIKVVNDTVKKYSAIIAQEEQGIYDGFKARNMTVTEIDRAQFEAAIAPLYTNNDLGLSPGLKDNLFRQLGL
jgi:TRAP-type C4-dicarboxylate transport system substrate-binding protein